MCPLKGALKSGILFMLYRHKCGLIDVYITPYVEFILMMGKDTKVQ